MGEIIEAVMKVARGDYSVQVELSGENDEFDSLAMGLNMMIEDIRIGMKHLDGQRKELSTINKRLEQHIAERKKMEEELQKPTHELGEPVRELNCLYGISELVEKENIFEILSLGG